MAVWKIVVMIGTGVALWVGLIVEKAIVRALPWVVVQVLFKRMFLTKIVLEFVWMGSEVVERAVFLAAGVESVVVTGEDIGKSIHRMGLQALSTPGRPGWESLVVFVSGVVGSGLRATLVYVGISAGRLME